MSLVKAAKEMLKVRGLLKNQIFCSTDAIQVNDTIYERSELKGKKQINTDQEINFCTILWLTLNYPMHVYNKCETNGILIKVLKNYNININNGGREKPMLGLYSLDWFSKSGETDDTDEDDSDETEESKGGPVRQSGGRLGTLDAASEAGYFHKTDKTQLQDLKKNLKNKAKEESSPENKED